MRKLLVALVVMAAACGGDAVVDEPTTSTTDTTTTTSTTVAPVGNVAAFFLHESGGNKVRIGPFLAPVARPGSGVEDAVNALLDGPTDAEVAAGFSTGVPEGVRLNGISVEEGVATVDLSGEFDDGGGTFSMTARLAQLAYTVTGADPEIGGVLIALDGEPVTVFSSEGLLIDEPMTRAEDLLPGILVESPAHGEVVSGLLEVSGLAAAFEGVFQLEIVDATGGVVASVPFVQTDNGLGWGAFSVEFAASELPAVSVDLTVHVYELSAEDGSVVAERFIDFAWTP